MKLLAVPDKFRGTVTAREAASAMAVGAADAGWEAMARPVADGGEGILDALGGPNRTSVVSGPLGDPVEAEWRLRRWTAVIEMAKASGLELVGGPEENDPVAASTYGTGELIAAALDAGARRVVVGVGGSATTDGGLGALRALEPLGRVRGIELLVACDVRTRFVDAAPTFAPQKGASPAQVELLTRRLDRLAQDYETDFGVDVRDLIGSGAAGGLAGGLAAIGARLDSGFEIVSEELDLDGEVDDVDLVVTGEGFLDDQSFEGKVVGGVIDLAAAAEVPVLAVVGDVTADVQPLVAAAEVPVTVCSLVERFGRERAEHDTEACITEAVTQHLS